MIGKRGMVLGKFLPPHAGHLYLVEFARRCVDELVIVVGTLAREPIDGALRARWMAELVPGARIVHLTDENPQDPAEHPEFWDIWRSSLLRALGDEPPDVVFASEPYGERLARELGARFVPVDVGRAAVPISGTAVRADPLGSWQYLPECVRAHYAVRVCVFGPESTGKSTLAARLATRYGTCVVPEFARTYLEQRGRAPVAEDMPVIARGQVASEDALARRCERLLVCDTDAVTTKLWSELLFGACDERVARLADERSYELTIVTDADVPYVADPVRYATDRAAFFERCIVELQARGRAHVVVRGDWDERFATACAAIDRALESVRARTRAVAAPLSCSPPPR